MRRFIVTVVLVATFLGLSNLVLAAVRFQDRPATQDNGTTLTVGGVLNGLGAGAVTVRLRATGTAAVICHNPGNEQPPGQNKSAQVPITIAGIQTIDASRITAGTVAFEVTTDEPSAASAKSLGCPNDLWTATVDEVTFKTVTIRVIQGGRTVLTRTVTF